MKFRKTSMKQNKEKEKERNTVALAFKANLLQSKIKFHVNKQ